MSIFTPATHRNYRGFTPKPMPNIAIRPRKELAACLESHAKEILGLDKNIKIKLSKKCDSFEAKHLTGFQKILKTMQSGAKEYVDEIWVVNQSNNPRFLYYKRCCKGIAVVNMKFLADLAYNPFKKDLHEYLKSNKDIFSLPLSDEDTAFLNKAIYFINMPEFS